MVAITTTDIRSLRVPPPVRAVAAAATAAAAAAAGLPPLEDLLEASAHAAADAPVVNTCLCAGVKYVFVKSYSEADFERFRRDFSAMYGVEEEDILHVESSTLLSSLAHP